MKNQYHKYGIALLKSRVCFVANCMAEANPQRDNHIFIIAQVCVCCRKATENGWAFFIVSAGVQGEGSNR